MPASGGDLGQTRGAAATHMKKSLPAQARPLALLAEINHTLAVARNVRAGLQRALEILAQQYRVLQAGWS